MIRQSALARRVPVVAAAFFVGLFVRNSSAGEEPAHNRITQTSWEVAGDNVGGTIVWVNTGTEQAPVWKSGSLSSFLGNTDAVAEANVMKWNFMPDQWDVPGYMSARLRNQQPTSSEASFMTYGPPYFIINVMNHLSFIPQTIGSSVYLEAAGMITNWTHFVNQAPGILSAGDMYSKLGADASALASVPVAQGGCTPTQLTAFAKRAFAATHFLQDSDCAHHALGNSTQCTPGSETPLCRTTVLNWIDSAKRRTVLPLKTAITQCDLNVIKVVNSPKVVWVSNPGATSRWKRLGHPTTIQVPHYLLTAGFGALVKAAGSDVWLNWSVGSSAKLGGALAGAQRTLAHHCNIATQTVACDGAFGVNGAGVSNSSNYCECEVYTGTNVNGRNSTLPDQTYVQNTVGAGDTSLVSLNTAFLTGELQTWNNNCVAGTAPPEAGPMPSPSPSSPPPSPSPSSPSPSPSSSPAPAEP